MLKQSCQLEGTLWESLTTSCFQPALNEDVERYSLSLYSFFIILFIRLFIYLFFYPIQHSLFCHRLNKVIDYSIVFVDREWRKIRWMMQFVSFHSSLCVCAFTHRPLNASCKCGKRELRHGNFTQINLCTHPIKQARQRQTDRQTDRQPLS